MMSNKISVLVIEDEDYVRNVLGYNLTMDGFEVYLADDGPTGLKIASEEKPHIILLDWIMPIMSGPEVLEKLKSDIQTSHTPVVMVTSRNMMDDLSKAFEVGAADYIIKPFDPTQLGERIKSIFAALSKKQGSNQNVESKNICCTNNKNNT